MKPKTIEWTLVKKLIVLNVLETEVKTLRETIGTVLYPFLCKIAWRKGLISDIDAKKFEKPFPELYKVIHKASNAWKKTVETDMRDYDWGWDKNDFQSRLIAIAKVRKQLTK